MIAGCYDRHILPRLIDLACAQRCVLRQRALIVPEAEGVVVELGIGSGINLDFYDKARVRRIIGVDRSPASWRLGHERLSRSPIAVELLEAAAEDLGLPSRTADTVVVTYTLCSIDGVGRALNEARRVLKPTGRLLFLEHGRSPEAALARWQNRLTPATRMLAGGCRLDRDPLDLIVNAGFRIERIQTGVLPGFPRLVAYHYVGAARPE